MCSGDPPTPRPQQWAAEHSLAPLTLSHSDLFLLVYRLIAEICHRNRSRADKGRSDTWENTIRAHAPRTDHVTRIPWQPDLNSSRWQAPWMAWSTKDGVERVLSGVLQRHCHASAVRPDHRLHQNPELTQLSQAMESPENKPTEAWPCMLRNRWPHSAASGGASPAGTQRCPGQSGSARSAKSGAKKRSWLHPATDPCHTSVLTTRLMSHSSHFPGFAVRGGKGPRALHRPAWCQTTQRWRALDLSPTQCLPPRDHGRPHH
ncbi:uncharacterized protein LOC114695500 [Peromyscus leucopus]|uniref:uncharacterized protein LOC114695500 n=1 Tax=Peromyscus leucopus TaxID=10041 RepID=UPI0010A0ECDD|nr:uncharacterized protein LOC114695500 [Peromyscus leucopus]